jgi:hypothetical protein
VFFLLFSPGRFTGYHEDFFWGNVSKMKIVIDTADKKGYDASEVLRFPLRIENLSSHLNLLKPLEEDYQNAQICDAATTGYSETAVGQTIGGSAAAVPGCGTGNRY